MKYIVSDKKKAKGNIVKFGTAFLFNTKRDAKLGILEKIYDALEKKQQTKAIYILENYCVKEGYSTTPKKRTAKKK